MVAAAPGPQADARPAHCASVPSDVAPGPIDSRGDALAGRYRLDGVLAEGGMATVYRAWHCLLEQPVALKMLRPEYSSVPEIAERFLQEARAVARLRSKHAVRVMDFGGTAEGNRYMVLELLNGRDLQHLLMKEGAQPVARAVGFVLQAAEALTEAHSTGLVHRDIKPANLFLAKEDGTELVKVIDFGICKSLCRKSEYRTLSKSYLGSPQYMSPEQIQSAASVDARTDIWSLGVVLFELLTGQAPFRGATLPALCASVIADTPSWPGHLPDELGRVVMRCLSKRREDRYATVAELARELEQCLGPADAAPVGSERHVEPQSNVRSRRRVNGWSQKGLLCGVLSAAAGAAGWGVGAFGLRNDPPSTQAIPPALVAAALAAGASESPEPVLIETSLQLDEGTEPAAFNTLAAAALSPPSVPETSARRDSKPPGAPTAVRASHPGAATSSSVDMEARYALTYQPDTSGSGSAPARVSDTPAAPSFDPALVQSDL